ncbi:MAG: enoyl-CoA hydratase/isomerase family protein [Deltaproteobacteria bacterium]|nr:enoyl-CoA hydratase/isomerase family protein [Deltaproteobacteria bacterium]
MTFAPLHVSMEDDGRIVLLRFHHGRANEMGRTAVDALDRLANRLEAGEARALLTWSDHRTRKGTPVFSAGADVRERTGWTDGEVLHHVDRQRRVMTRLQAAPVLHVCVVDGAALGWGTEYALAADYVVAGPSARFGLPETGLGVVPGSGGTARLAARVGLAHALRLALTGELVDATEAVRIGLAQEVAPSGEAALDRARVLARLACRRSPTALAACKTAMTSARAERDRLALHLEGRAYEHCVHSGDAARGRAAFETILAGGEVDWSPRERFQP